MLQRHMPPGLSLQEVPAESGRTPLSQLQGQQVLSTSPWSPKAPALPLLPLYPGMWPPQAPHTSPVPSQLPPRLEQLHAVSHLLSGFWLGAVAWWQAGNGDMAEPWLWLGALSGAAAAWVGLGKCWEWPSFLAFCLFADLWRIIPFDSSKK